MYIQQAELFIYTFTSSYPLFLCCFIIMLRTIRPIVYTRPMCGTFNRRYCVSTMQQYAPRRSFAHTSPSPTMTTMRGFRASLKPLAIATATIGSSAFLKKPVLCQQGKRTNPNSHHSKLNTYAM